MTITSPQEKIRNFAIIAHIDHGKSTLADRLLEATRTVPERKMRRQFLDNMELEREKGITIKLKTVRMRYELSEDLKRILPFDFCLLNLIDTPGHVDFAYEVSRSLAACEGALLLVDASQGVQAQTVSNAYKALDLGLTVIPIVNKIDLDYADPEGTAAELKEYFGFSDEEILFVSAKEGLGTDIVLEAIVKRVPAPSGTEWYPAPKGSSEALLRALVFDSFYDEHKGVIAIARIVDGGFVIHDSGFKIQFLGSQAECEPLEVGYFTPEMEPSKALLTGEVGYIATGLKDLSQVRVGDTISVAKENLQGLGTPTLKVEELAAVEPLPGYREPKPVVFANIFPVDKDDFVRLKDALEKLSLNDASLVSQPVSSPALGRGFELGLLGVLHLEIVRERLEREYDLDLVVTAPTVEYEIKVKSRPVLDRVETRSGKLKVKSAEEVPEKYDEISEPWAEVKIITPYEYIGEVMRVIDEARGSFLNQQHLGERRARIECEIPLAELIATFYDRLKSASSGFASLDWKFKDYRPVEAGKLEILVNREVVEAFSRVIVKERANEVGRRFVKKLKEILPREQFMVPLQAAFNGKIIARESIPALRKDVTAKLYGGDQTRKDKLLKKQKAGKKKLAQIGRVRIPKEAFREILEI